MDVGKSRNSNSKKSHTYSNSLNFLSPNLTKPHGSAVDLSAKQIQSSIGLIAFFGGFVLLKGHSKMFRQINRDEFFFGEHCGLD